MSTFRFQATIDVTADSQEEAEEKLGQWKTLGDVLGDVDDHGGFEMVEEWVSSDPSN